MIIESSFTVLYDPYTKECVNNSKLAYTQGRTTRFSFNNGYWLKVWILFEDDKLEYWTAYGLL